MTHIQAITPYKNGEDLSSGTTVWMALGNPQPASTTNFYVDEADMISSLDLLKLFGAFNDDGFR